MMNDLPSEVKNSITIVGLKSYIVWNRCAHGHVVFRFPNGYGASIIRHPFSIGYERGLFELAVLEWSGEDYDLCYTTSITSDVVGNLTGKGVEELLAKIKKLPDKYVLPTLDKYPELE